MYRNIYLFLLFLAICVNMSAQNSNKETVYEEMVESVYFDFDKHFISKPQQESILKFIQSIDSTKIMSVEIFGYCDDRGKDDYNIVLSNKRAKEVQDLMIQYGVTQKIMVTIEGKGRVLIDDDIVENLPAARTKNRRVDILVLIKPEPNPELNIPGVYTQIKKDLNVGDRIYLENLLFDRGSSKLTALGKKELDRIVREMQKFKNYHFEIQGHVCCTPSYHKEAVDRETRKRELSKNRAEVVYKYLIFKKIPKTRLTHKGMGNAFPLGKTPTLDRRVELVITKK
jgi:outer membrane protein OmpA-like peptidoglycan-associated protein